MAITGLLLLTSAPALAQNPPKNESSSSGPAAPPPASRDDRRSGSVADEIAAVQEKGGSSAWDKVVTGIMLRAFDRDGSKRIDSASELDRIDCATWRALDAGMKRGGRTGMVVTYGFGPQFIYVGYAIGIHESQRSRAYSRMLACGVPDSASGKRRPEPASPAPIPSPGRGSVADEIAAVQEKGGSSAWDRIVTGIMLRAFDRDRSGSIDSTSELDAIDCATWRALDSGMKRGGRMGLIVTYGFGPGFIYVGHAVGINASMRERGYQRMGDCGVRR
ncbi:MAG: hypothetical protein AB7E70_20735 [Hyphomicrobiaceae bacterium]